MSEASDSWVPVLARHPVQALQRAISRSFAWINRHRTVAWILLVGLLIRYALAIYTAVADTATFTASATSMAYGQAPYTYLIFYPPGWVFTLGLLGRIFSAFFSPEAIVVVPQGLAALGSNPAYWFEPPYYPALGFDLLLKSFIFVFDVLTAVLLYVIVQERTGSSRSATRGTALWMLNPLAIIVSSVHGTYDSIPAFLMVLAYYLATKGDFLFSGISLSLGAIMKVFPVFLFPIFLLFIWDATRGKQALARSWLMFSIGFGLVLALVFWPPGIFGQWFTLLFTGAARGGEPFGGFNEWAFLSIPSLYWLAPLASANAEKIIVVLLVELTIALVYIVWRTVSTPRRTEAARIPYWDGLVLFAICVIYFGVPVVQPQYLVWVLPWLILLTVVYGSSVRYSWTPYLVVSAGVTLFYLFGLTSPLFFFQPLFFNTQLLGTGTLVSSLNYWTVESPLLRPYFLLPVMAALLLTAWFGLRVSNIASVGR